MSLAQDRLRELVEWVKASSTDVPAPLGHDTIVRGPYAVFVPQNLNLPPSPAFDSRHLPLWVPADQSVLGLPSWNVNPPQSQDHTDQRLRHIIWMFESGRFKGALIGLTDPSESLQTALDQQLPGLDLEVTLALFLPLWLLNPEDRAWAEARLPIVAV